MKQGIRLNRMLGKIHIYPTLAEANKYVAGVWKKAHAPAALLRWLERFHACRRRGPGKENWRRDDCSQSLPFCFWIAALSCSSPMSGQTFSMKDRA